VTVRVQLLVLERVEDLGRAGGLPSGPTLSGLSEQTWYRKRYGKQRGKNTSFKEMTGNLFRRSKEFHWKTMGRTKYCLWRRMFG
jgi:hypothetical protein